MPTKEDFTEIDTEYISTEFAMALEKLSPELITSIKQAFSRTALNFPLPDSVEPKDLSPKAEKQKPFLSGSRFTFHKPRKNWEGVTPEDVRLPNLPKGSKILDVGAGDGLISQRMRDNLGCEVYALEPCIDSDSDYSSCLKKLGDRYCYKLTLQRAIDNYPDYFQYKYDAVTVFKYNVPGEDKEGFIKALAKTIKPNGFVYITSVEADRLFFDSISGKNPYIIDVLKEYFGEVQIGTVKTVSGQVCYGQVTCSKPKPILDITFESSQSALTTS